MAALADDADDADGAPAPDAAYEDVFADDAGGAPAPDAAYEDVFASDTSGNSCLRAEGTARPAPPLP